MAELALTRSADDKRRYDLPGYGSVRKPGWSNAVVELSTADGVVLADAGRVLLRLDCKSWGKSPVSVVIGDDSTEAVLVLFTISVARTRVAGSDAGGA